jgi:hypothetical protein
MVPINSGSFTKALWPGVNSWYGEAYEEQEVKWTSLYDQFTSRRAFEEDVGVSGFGLLQVKPEGSSVTFDTMTQGFVTRYTHIVYASGFVITKEMRDDDQYDVVAEKRAKGLAYSVRQTYEVVGHNIYNRAFNTNYTGGDGKALLVSDHPNVAGGTWSNVPSVTSSLSEASLEQARIDIMRYTNDRGLRINVMPQSLIIPPELEAEAHRILKSKLRVNTPNNDDNFIGGVGMFPKGITVSPYLSSTTAWFIRTNVKDGLKHFEREAPSFSADNDWDTENAKYKVMFRCAFGWTDGKSLYGSAGV